ncbi:MAG: metallopeptidase TldD-related protein [Oscillospiraceae bacterium]|nr:metallopeptidase TldD-related protein [Oscillospiraceae bacterium]
MLNLLINTLKEFEGVEYLIKESNIHRIENYNIKKRSEMFREVDVTELLLTVYVTFSQTDENGEEIKYKGSYDTQIHPGTSFDNLRKIISQAVFAAGFVKNAWYPLVLPAADDEAAGAAAVAAMGAGAEVTLDEKEALKKLQAAFYEDDNHERGHIAYSEFFLTRRDVRILNSSGVDVSYSAYEAYVETAVHWRSEAEGEERGEIEVYEDFRFSLSAGVDAACEMLKSRVAQLFSVAEKKAAAVPTPQVNDINILLSGDCLREFFGYYLQRADAQLIYQKLSTYEEGAQVQGGEGHCDKISLTLKPMLKGSAQGRPYDDDGMQLAEHDIILGGKLQKVRASTRFASYLGIAPTGSTDNFHITGGTASTDELKREPYLELISFSSFEVNPVTGDFGSEIRLGFYFDGEKTIPVTGGSISGNAAQVQDTLRMSAKERQYNNYLGPETISFRRASISGA